MSRMIKAADMLESWKSEKLLTVASHLPREKAMEKLEIWSERRLQKLRLTILMKILTIDVPEKRHRKLLNFQVGDALPEITTVKLFKKWSKRRLLKFKETELPRVLIKPKRLKNWSRRWLQILRQKVLSRIDTTKVMVTQLKKCRHEELLRKTTVTSTEVVQSAEKSLLQQKRIKLDHVGDKTQASS